MAGPPSKKLKLNVSDYDYSAITWEVVLPRVDISDIEKVAVATEAHRLDPESSTLQHILAGKDWAKETLTRATQIPLAVLTKISDLASSLNIPTKRHEFEKSLPAPSDYGNSQCHSKEDHVIDHRNIPGKPSLHVGLQVELFGEFIDDVNTDPQESKYYEFAANLMQKMSGYFATEQARQNAFLEVVTFCERPIPVHLNRAKSDATISVVQNGRNVPIVNFEFKNEFGATTSCPNKQNIACFKNFKQGEDAALIGTFRSPMLLISVIGTHYLQVFGSVWNGSDVCVDPLTPPISLLFVPRDPLSGAKNVARVLSAIDTAIPKLRQYYNSPESFGNKGPYYLRDTELQYQGCIRGVPWLYSAMMNGKEVCVKFVPERYGDMVHQFLAQNKLAPQLLRFEDLAGGWKAVIMEKINDSVMISTTNVNAVKASLKTVLELMAEKDFVHGDLRQSNILVVNDKDIYIVDFDWAGKENDTKYPASLRSYQEWHPDVVPMALIKKEHDEYIINHLTA